MYFQMIKKYLSFILFIVCIFSFLSCKSAVTLQTGQPGKIKVNIKWVSPDGSKVITPNDVNEIFVTVQGKGIPDDRPILAKISGSNSGIAEISLPAGTKTVTIEAFNSKGQSLGLSQEIVIVKEGKLQSLDMILKEFGILSTVSSPSPSTEANSSPSPSTTLITPMPNPTILTIPLPGVTPTPFPFPLISGSPTPTPNPNIGPLIAIEITPGIANVMVGTMFQFAAIGRDEKGQTTGISPTWSVSNNALGIIENNGIFTAKSIGNVTVNAKYSNFDVSVNVNISPSTIASITVQPSTGDVSIYTTQQLISIVKDSLGNIINNPVISWVSSDTSIGTINSTGLFIPNNTGKTGTVTITATAGGMLGMATLSVYIPVPIINELSPSSASGGSIVNILGNNFDVTFPGNNIVTFNGVNGTVANVSNNAIRVIVPDSLTGTVTVEVTVRSKKSNSLNFEIVPTLNSLSSYSGVGGSVITLNGSGFNPIQGNNLVTFGSTNSIVTSASGTTLMVIIPDNIDGTVPVKVKTGTMESNSLNFSFTPVISNISSAGRIGDTIVISGKGFSSSTGNNTVKFAGVVANVTNAGITSLSVIVPPNIYGTVSVTVTVGTQTSNNTSFAVTPTITSIPPNGTIGNTINITGTGFSISPSNNIVEFGGKLATVSSASNTLLTVVVPNDIVGTVPVSVQVGTQVSNAVNFDLNPYISSLSPSTDIIGATINITGSGFSPVPSDNIVNFSGINTPVISATTTNLTINVPANINGTVSVYVKVGVRNSNSVNFNVKPQISGSSSTFGQIGSSITLSGTGFSPTPGNNYVYFGSYQASVTSATNTTLMVIVPSNISGTVGVYVVVAGQSSNTVNFDVVPRINGFSPGSATGQLGDNIGVNGNGYSTTPSSNTVTFNGIGASVISASTTSLTVTIPYSLTIAGSVAVQVKVGAQTSSTSYFTILTPCINFLSPSNGQIGQSIIIASCNNSFSNVTNYNEVFFDAQPAIVTSASNSSLTVVVPSGITAIVPVSVRIGTQISNTQNFSVSPPTITGPALLSGALGATITINGSNFSPITVNNIVSFNGVLTSATWVNGTRTAIQVVVPPGFFNPTFINVTVGIQTSNSWPFNLL